MTEYDFSPEAYERHLEKQHNIARWVDKTRRYAPANPFIAATPADRHAALHTDTSHTRNDTTEPHRHHRSRSSPSSKNHSRRHRSTEPSSSHRSNSSSIPRAPPAQWQPVVDHRTGAYYANAPHHPAPVYQQRYPDPPRPPRSHTAPIYLFPAPGNPPYAAYPNPIAPQASTRRVGSKRSSHSVSGFGWTENRRA